MNEIPSYHLTGVLIDFALCLPKNAIPTQVAEAANLALLDALGNTIGGAQHALTARLTQTLAPFFGPGNAVLLGQENRIDALNAALINGTAGAANSFFDTYSEAMLHPSGPILTTLLALCSIDDIAHAAQADGRELLAAFTVGLEIACRLTKATTVPPAQANMSFSQSGLVCGIAAAIAGGRLAGLTPAQMRAAVGIAISEAAGTRVEHGSMTASLIFGRAAQSATRAVLLARKDFTSNPNALEAPHGYLDVYSQGATSAALLGGLGQSFELLSNSFKPFPTGVVVHPAIDAMLRLRRAGGWQSQQISAITIAVPHRAMTFGNRPRPLTDLEAKFSIQHWVAAVALTGHASLEQGRQAMVSNPEIRRLREIITLTLDEGLGPDGARIELAFADGTRRKCHVEAAIGSPAAPMSRENLIAKFSAQVTPVLGAAQTQELVALCQSLETLTAARDLSRLTQSQPVSKAQQ